MVGIKTLKSYELNNIEEYFNYIIDSIINGQKKQAKTLINKLSKDQKKEFINFTLECGSDSYIIEATNLTLSLI
jgi:hypothetical protein